MHVLVSTSSTVVGSVTHLPAVRYHIRIDGECGSFVVVEPLLDLMILKAGRTFLF